MTLVRLGIMGMAVCLVTLGGLVTQISLPVLQGVSLQAVLCALVGIGFCAALVGIPLQTLIQEETPPEMRGKVFGLQNNGVNIALSLPLVLASIAEQTLGLGWTFIALGGVMVLGLGLRYHPH
jgi:MFS family permease